MTIPSIEYLAGHFDGEGCISMGKRSGGNTYRILITVTGAYLPTLCAYRDTFSGTIRPHRNKTGKPLHQWELIGFIKCLSFIRRMIPLLREKHSQAEMALRYLEERGKFPARGSAIRKIDGLALETFINLRAAKHVA